MAKLVTAEELKAHATDDSIWIVIHEKVYDVSKFKDEHPGGEDVIKEEAGKDATAAFEDVGHSDEARELLPAMFVGDIQELPQSDKPMLTAGPTVHAVVEKGSNLMYIFPLGLLAAYFAWRFSGTA